MLLIRNACYDCHSNQTNYPFYTRIYPLRHWIKVHVEEGRKELNFSKWGQLSETERLNKLDFISHEVERNTMPLSSYRRMHSDARLSEEQKADLIKNIGKHLEKKYFERVVNNISDEDIYLITSLKKVFKLTTAKENFKLVAISFDTLGISATDTVPKNNSYKVVETTAGGKDIMVKDPGNGKFYPLTQFPGDEYLPSISRDNSFLYFIHTNDDSSSLMAMDMQLWKFVKVASLQYAIKTILIK